MGFDSVRGKLEHPGKIGKKQHASILKYKYLRLARSLRISFLERGNDMDLQTNLIESGNKKKKRRWKQLLFSVVFHGGLLAAIIFITAATTHKVTAEDKATPVFLSQGAAPPPPPPPPPPPAASSAPQRATPKVTPIQPKIVQPSFVQPREIPKELPKIVEPVVKTENLAPSPVDETKPAPPSGAVAGGVGGVVGGEKGGTVGGEVGGQIGGVVGGEKGGVLGGKVGGTGTGTEGEGNGKDSPPDRPLRVGGDVKAPVITSRVEPQYNEAARKARITGVVIVEAIINKQGRVEQVKVIKGLPMGLSD